MGKIYWPVMQAVFLPTVLGDKYKNAAKKLVVRFTKKLTKKPFSIYLMKIIIYKMFAVRQARHRL
jgi:predicted Na+-dependent transporter